MGINVQIDCDSSRLRDIFVKNFSGVTLDDATFELHYRLESEKNSGAIDVSRPDSEFHRTTNDVGQLIYFLEGDLVVQLQLLRADLLFLHAAVVSDGESAHLLTGPSGAGKSTTCWGLLHHGFHYVSDELAPIAIENKIVSPYSHALCLKSPPPAGYDVPRGKFVTERGIHIPLSAMRSPHLEQDLPIGSILFVEHRAEFENASIEQVGHAEAAARLYPNILNALAHSNDGLDAALELTRNVSCYRVEAADLSDTCKLIVSAVGDVSAA